MDKNSSQIDEKTAVPLVELDRRPLTPSNEPEEGPDSNHNDYGKRPACFGNTLQECLFVLTTTVAVGMNSFFGGAILCMTNAIGEALDMNAAQVTWLW
jgi:hypothetical protein